MEPTRRSNEATEPKRVTISCDGEDLASVPQRDLFSKYGWPAKEEIVTALKAFKERREAGQTSGTPAPSAPPHSRL